VPKPPGHGSRAVTSILLAPAVLRDGPSLQKLPQKAVAGWGQGKQPKDVILEAPAVSWGAGGAAPAKTRLARVAGTGERSPRLVRGSGQWRETWHGCKCCFQGGGR